MWPTREKRPQNAKYMYWGSVVALVLMNAAGLCALFSMKEVNVFMAVVLILNLGVILTRAVYAGWHSPVLFSDENFRKVEEATNAERLGLYAFVVIIGSGVIEGAPLELDNTLDLVGRDIMALAMITPVVTYLVSGYGKFRDIVLSSPVTAVKERRR